MTGIHHLSPYSRPSRDDRAPKAERQLSDEKADQRQATSGKRPVADGPILLDSVSVDIARWAFVLFLLFWVALALFGLRQKLRDGEVGWKFNNMVSQRHGRDQFGYWLSVSFNVILAAAAFGLAVAVVVDRIPVTWGR